MAKLTILGIIVVIKDNFTNFIVHKLIFHQNKAGWKEL